MLHFYSFRLIIYSEVDHGLDRRDIIDQFRITEDHNMHQDEEHANSIQKGPKWDLAWNLLAMR